MSVIVLDAGNSVIKAKIARRGCGEATFPHALKPLTETEYSNVKVRASATGPPLDYIQVNSQPYVVGASAERHGTPIQHTGAARYSRDYYGVMAAAAMGRLYQRSREVSIFGSHAPGDVRFRQDLMEAVIGDWHVEVGRRERHFRVSYANTFDEPVVV